MTEERLQEIKDSIELQYKIQEANNLDSFNIFTDEEQELVEEVERLQQRIDKAIEYINYAIESDDIEELRSARHLLLFNEDLDKLLNILKGSDKYV